jgi:hypothetical protein
VDSPDSLENIPEKWTPEVRNYFEMTILDIGI